MDQKTHLYLKNRDIANEHCRLTEIRQINFSLSFLHLSVLHVCEQRFLLEEQQNNHKCFLTDAN